MIDTQVRTFFATGRLTVADTAGFARECDRLVRLKGQESLKAALTLAKRFVQRAEPHAGVLLETAYRSLGWICHLSCDYRGSERAYLKARQLAAGDALKTARIDRILIDVYMYLGDWRESRRRTRLALAAFKRLGAEDEAARTRVNYANVLHRQDRHKEALAQYAKAAQHFGRRGDELALALCQYNQANALVQLCEFAQAQKLYETSEERFNRLGYKLYGNECCYGQAWLHLQQGKYHRALQELAKCEQTYAGASQPKGIVLCRLDRAEAYLGLNLFADARTLARAAYQGALKLGLNYETAKASFFLARALHATGNSKGAQAALRVAARHFKQEDNRAFLAAVQLTAAQIDNQHTNPAVLNAARTRFARVQLPLWEAVCDLQLLSTDPDNRPARQRLQRNAAVKAVPFLAAQWQTLCGDRAMQLGQGAKAKRHWARAVSVLDAVRVSLPPVELRSAFLKNRSNPYRRLVHSEADANPAQAAAWSERLRTAGLWAPLPEDPDTRSLRYKAEAGLAELASQVTAMAARVDGTGRRSSCGAALPTHVTKLQRRVRDHLAALHLDSDGTPPTLHSLVEEFRSVARNTPIVQFHRDGDDLLAFVHTRAGVTCHRYADGHRTAKELMGCWHVLLSRAINSRGKISAVELEDEQRLLSHMREWLWSPLSLSSVDADILVIPDASVANYPWQAIVPTQPVVLSPSLRHYLHADSQIVRSRRVDVFVGKSRDLRAVPAEIGTISSAIGYDIQVHRPCTRHDWPQDTTALAWHYTGHASHRGDNPFYSALQLEDGPLFAADLRLMHNRVGLVTLAACRTGQQSYLPGEEPSGLVRSLLEMNARSVIASHWAVCDRSASLWVRTFYEHFLAGQSVRMSFESAVATVKQQYPSAYNWAAFSIFGAG